MPEGSTYQFDSTRTDYSTCFMLNGERHSYLAEPIALPSGTLVTLSDGTEATVISSRLDLSNESNLAMIYVDVELAAVPKPPQIPQRVR